MPRAHIAVAVALALAVACKEPRVPHPLATQFRYICCNLHYEKPEITDANYLRGKLIPLGTRVQILEVRKDSVKFEAAGYPPITLALKYGARNLTMDQYLGRIFLVDDPYGRLPKLPDGKQGRPDPVRPGPDHDFSFSASLKGGRRSPGDALRTAVSLENCRRATVQTCASVPRGGAKL